MNNTCGICQVFCGNSWCISLSNKELKMQINEEGLNLLKSFEGCKLSPYLDLKGVPTIGYGNTYYEDNTTVTMDDVPITQERAETLLKQVLASFESHIEKFVTVDLSNNEFSSLVVFSYNIGLGNFQHSTLLKLLNNDADRNEVAKQFLVWDKVKQNGVLTESSGLLRRRKAERDLFLSLT